MIADNATEAAVSSVVRSLSVVIQQSQSTTAGNLASVVSILGNVSSLSTARHFRVSNSTMEVWSVCAWRALFKCSISQEEWQKPELMGHDWERPRSQQTVLVWALLLPLWCTGNSWDQLCEFKGRGSCPWAGCLDSTWRGGSLVPLHHMTQVPTV